MIPHPVAAQATCSPGAEPAVGRILIAGGEPGIRSLIGGALAAAGYVTDLASTGTEGLRQALECHYDLIILDLGTPGPGPAPGSGLSASPRRGHRGRAAPTGPRTADGGYRTRPGAADPAGIPAAEGTGRTRRPAGSQGQAPGRGMGIRLRPRVERRRCVRPAPAIQTRLRPDHDGARRRLPARRPVTRSAARQAAARDPP